MVDKDGNKVVSYEYDSWGNITNSTSTVNTGDGVALDVANPFRYSSYFYDEETDFYYLKARYYDADLGRFLTRDAVLNNNLYTYCDNNPVMYIDSDGNFFMLVTGLVGAGIGAIGGAIYSYAKYGEVRLKNVAAGAAIGGAVGLTGGAAGAYLATGSAFASTGVVTTSIGVGATATVGGGGTVLYKTLEKGVNFTQTTLKRMQDANRFVPVQTLIDAIKNGVSKADPQGSSAIMYYIDMIKNGKTYKLEVLYDEVSNTIWHFLYK